LEFIPTLNYQEKHQELQRKRLENSAQWFLRLPEYKNWVNATSSETTLWCPGHPGVGKTFLTLVPTSAIYCILQLIRVFSSIIVDTLLYRVRLNKGRVAYFYFNYGEQIQQKPERVLQCLLRQVLYTYQCLPESAAELHTCFQQGQSLPAWEKLVKIFGKLCAENTETYIILDALDECNPNDHRRSIIELLATLRDLGVRTCVTSREFAEDISFAFSKSTKVKITASEDDMRRLLEIKIASARHMSRLIDKDLKEDIVQTILGKSRGM